MRGVVLALAVGVASWLAAPAAAVEPRIVPLPEGAFGGEVDGGSLFWVDHRRGRDRLVRFGLATRARTVLWRLRGGRESIVRVEAGGGVVAIEVLRGLERTRVLAIDPATGAPTSLGSGRFFLRRGCGRDLKLDDVSETGDIVVAQAHVPCTSRRGTFLVRAFRTTGPPLVLERRPTRLALVSDGGPYRMLQGTHYLVRGDRVARVRDLTTGRETRIHVPGRAWFLGDADVAPDGRALLNVVRGGPGFPVQRLLLDDRVVFDSSRWNDGYAEASFCGRHAVRHVVGPRRELLTLLEPATTLRDGRPLSFDFVTTCDARHYVVLDGKKQRALVYDLPE